MLNDLKRTDLPLENAVFALHGAKILGGLKNTAKNEALAEVSGRKKSPLPVKGGKSQNDTVSLSDEERYVAKKLGLTDKEYSKWKEGN
jgi:phage I-like protein